MNFDIVRCVLGGVIATMVMTGFLNSFAFFFEKKFRVVPLLGTMLTGETTLIKGISFSHRAVFIGLVVHYFIGFVFSVLYYLWSVKRGSISMLNTLLFGVCIGTLAVIAWRLFFYVHSRPPRINLAEYCKLIFVAHLLFAMMLFVVYTL